MKIAQPTVLLALLSGCAAPAHDVVVYGCTSAGIMAAVQAKRMGKSVVGVGPDQHLGGLSAGGLGWTDSGNKAVIGGLARAFYSRVFDHYASDDAWRWQSESAFATKRGPPSRLGRSTS